MHILHSIAFATAVATGIALTVAPGLAQTQQKYPSKPVRIVVPFSAGSATDITARMLAPRLSEKWGQPVVVENRPGGGSTLAAAVVAKATPDGHTLLLISASFAITAVLQPNLPYDPLKDFAGRVHFGIPSLGPAMPFIKDGRLLPLAVVIPQRSPLLPDVPAMVEVLPGYERDATHGLLAPARTPRPILHQISRDVAGVLDLPEVKQHMQAMGFVPAPTTPEEYDRIQRSLIETFSKVARVAGLRAP